MGILITAASLLITAGALGVLRAVRRRFRFSWLLALAGALAAVLSAAIMRAQLPSQLDLPLWRSHSTSASFATFSVGNLTWPFALGLPIAAATFLLAAPGRPRFPAPRTWSICLMIAGLGILALSADSPLTLVLVWAALDLTEAGLLLARLENRTGSMHVPYAFAMRLASIGLVMLAFVLGDAPSTGATFAELGPAATLGLFPMAALFRLAAFALPWPKDSAETPDDLGSILQITAGAASVAFLAQLPASAGSLPVIAIAALVGLYAGLMFFRAQDLQESRPLWIMSVGGLSVAASLSGNPTGSAAWCVGILIAGSALFVNSMPGKGMQRSLLLVLWILSGLPLSLTASAWSAPAGSWTWALPLFLVSQALLLAGSLHQALKPQAGFAMRVEVLALEGIRYASVGLPLLVGMALGLLGWPGAMQIGAPFAALLVIPLTAALVWAKRRMPVLNPGSADLIPKRLTSAAAAIRRAGSRLTNSLQGLADGITRTMEGEAGIMWGLLFLVLFVSLIVGGSR